MDALRKGLYPDVAVQGGLGAAMAEASRLRGCDIGPSSSEPDVVRIETARGFVSVHLATEERLFLVGVHGSGFTWASGSTSDLGLVVEAVAAWRDGMSLDEFEARFEFMWLDDFARALEAGDPTPLQWSRLLTADFHSRQRDLLHRIHSDEVLRDFFPMVSHGAVRLRVDPFDGQSRQVLVVESDEGGYEVLHVGVPQAAWIAVPTDALVAHLRAFLSRS